MSTYVLKVITKESTRTVRLSHAKTERLKAEENTTYQIFDEHGELVIQPKTEVLNQEDIAIYLESETLPRFILEGYYSHYPIEDAKQLMDISASLATSSQDVAVVATPISTGNFSKTAWAIVGSLAAVGGMLGISQYSNLSNRVSKKKSANTPINLSVELNSVTDDNILNQTESTGNVTVSGKLLSDQPFTQAKVVLEIGNQQIEAVVVNDEFTVEVLGSLLREYRQIKAIATVENTTSRGVASQIKEYTVDVEMAPPRITLNTITDDNVLNISESQSVQIISGYVENINGSSAKPQDKVVIQIGEERIETQLKPDLSFEVPTSGQLLSENRKVIVLLETHDNAGNTLLTREEKDYAVDLAIAHPDIQILTLATDNIINLRESGEMLTLSGRIVNSLDSVAKVGDKLNIQVGDKTFTTTLDENLSFSLDINGQILAMSDNVIVSLATTDDAGNNLTTVKTKSYTVDTIISDPKIVIDSIAQNDLLNATDLNGEITISGNVTNEGNSSAKAGDIVLLTIGNHNLTAQLDDLLKFRVSVSGSLLKESRRIDATLVTEDQAGNRKETQSSRDYVIDQEIFHPTITLNPVTNDNTLNQAEGTKGQNITISGKVDNVENSEAKAGDKVVLTIAEEQFETELTNNLTFSINLSGDVLVNVERKIKVSLATKDIAGNQLVTRTEHDYFIDQLIADPAILIENITQDNIVNLQESSQQVVVSGKVENLTNTEAKPGDRIIITIGEQTFETTLNTDLRFEVNAGGQLLIKNNKVIATLETSDDAGNTLSTTTEKTYGVDVSITHPTIVLADITHDNIVNVTESQGSVITVGGQVTNVAGSEAKVNDKVTVMIGEQKFETILKDNLSFEVNTSGQLLAENDKISVMLETRDSAGNTLITSEEKFYGKDLLIANPEITFATLATDNIINLRESGEMQTLRGSVTNSAEGAVAKAGDKLTIQIGSNTFTATLNDQLEFSLEVSGQILAATDKAVVTLVTTDTAQNTLTTTAEKPYTVDTVITDPKIVIHSVTEDGVLNIQELEAPVTITGSVTNVGDSAAKKDDVITLEIGGTSVTAKLDEQLNFSVQVEGSALKDHRRIDATLATEDTAGNRIQTQAARDYVIDREIFHPKITFNSVTPDNTINKAEGASGQQVAVSGKVENVEGSEAKAGDKVMLTIGSHQAEATLTNDLTFSVNVPGDVLAANTDRKIHASLATKDIAQNTLTTKAEHDYFIDQVIENPTITIENITPDNIVNIAERGQNIVVKGKVENITNSEAKPNDKVVIKIGERSFDAVLQSDLSFQAEVEGSLLAANTRIEASLATKDAAENSLTAVKTHDYRVDTDIAASSLVIDKIATDDIINAVEARASTITITGSATNTQFAEAKQGDTVVLQVGELRVEGQLDAELKFSIPVSTIALVNHKSVVATLVSSDEAQNSATATANRPVTVDTDLALSVSVNQITVDNVVNRTESEQNVTLSGTYTADSDVRAGTVAISVLINGQTRQATVNEADKTWTLSVAGADLVPTQGERSVTATITAKDNAGNEGAATKEHQYRVDTHIDKPVVTITSIAGDDVIDSTEANGSIKITGIVENYEGNNPVVLICPCTACASGWKEVEATVVDGKFEVDVLVSETSLANAKLKSSERVVKAKYTAKDTAGNEAAADEASRKYEIESNDREVNITKIGNGFDMSSGATTRISGTIETFGSSNVRFDDIYNLGQNPRLVRMVKMVIGDKTYKVGFNGVTKSFYADIPNTELAALSGKSISLDFSDTFSTGINFYAAVFPMLTLIRNGVKVSDSVSNVVPTAKKFTLEGDVLVKNGDNSYSIKEIKPQMTEISGTVKGDIEVGAEIEVKVGNFTTTTVVKEGKVFSVEVEDRHLKNNTAQVVTATLKNSGSEVVTDSEVYILPKAVSSNFVSQHTEVPVSARKMDHTKDDYNFFYPIHLMETETTKRGALKNVAVGGTETPFVYKYHFLRTDEIASLPTNRVQGAIYNDRLKESEPGSIKEVTDLTKEMFRHAYKKLSEYTNIRFEEVNSWQEANGNNSELGTGTDGSLIFMSKLTGIYANAAAIGYQGGNVVWNETVSGANPQKTDYNHYLALHEIMHTLNLRHAHESFSGLGRNAISGNVPTATAENHISEASGEFSHMSYWNVATAMGDRDMRLYDLAYLHYRFGVNREHRAGNDVYTFKTYDTRKVDGDVYIWDGNGVDTFDASAEKEGVTVNLTPGSWNYRGTERKFNFLSDGRDIYDRYSYFGLDGSETIGGRVRNSFTERFNPVPDTANQVEIKKYQEGQSFIGYGTQIENLIGSKFGDKLTGNNADNNIFGGAGDDTIIGGLGDDFINGGEGNDLMFGNAGNDTYVVDSVGDVITEKADEGEADHVYSFINHTLESNVENLTLVGTTAKEGVGNAQNNIIRANDIGNTLNGMDGDDTLIGGLGKDTLTGGNGNDIFVFDSALNGKADTITDFVVGQDKIQLSREIFTSLNSDLSNLKAHLFYDAASGELSYNSATTGADSAVHFVTVAGLQNLDGDKFIIG